MSLYSFVEIPLAFTAFLMFYVVDPQSFYEAISRIAMTPMCRMLAVIGPVNKKRIVDSLIIGIIDMALERTGETHEALEENPEYVHDSGWGVAWIEEGDINLYRSPTPIFEDKLALEKLKHNFIFREFLLFHARKASPTFEPKIENTHPFITDFEGLPVVFSHNGELKESFFSSTPPLKQYQPTGETDSERFFYYLLEQIESPDNLNKTKMEKILRNIPEDSYTAVNFILATPKDVFVNVQYSVKPKYFTMKQAMLGETTIVSSEKFSLDNVSWEPIPNNTLLHFSLLQI